MWVENMKDTGDEQCSCGSWLEHWENYSRQAMPYTCPTKGCSEGPTVGAHVVRAFDTSGVPCIVPLCDGCNKREGIFDIDEGVALVRADACC